MKVAYGWVLGVGHCVLIDCRLWFLFVTIVGESVCWRPVFFHGCQLCLLPVACAYLLVAVFVIFIVLMLLVALFDSDCSGCCIYFDSWLIHSP